MSLNFTKTETKFQNTWNRMEKKNAVTRCSHFSVLPGHLHMRNREGRVCEKKKKKKKMRKWELDLINFFL